MATAVDIGSRTEVLAQVPLLSVLESAELADLAARMDDVAFRKGDVVFREHDPGDSLMVLLSGELEVSVGEGDARRVINRLGPGEFLGEISLLTGEPRSATVTAVRPARALLLGQDDFRRSIASNARVLEYLSRTLSQRLVHNTRSDSTARRTTVIGVLAGAGLHGKSLVAWSLAALVHQLTGRSTLVVRVSPGGNGAQPLLDLAKRPWDRISPLLEPDTGPTPVLETTLEETLHGHALAGALADFVGNAQDRFSFVVFDLPAAPIVEGTAVAEACDVLVELVQVPDEGDVHRYGPHTRVFQVANRYNDGTPVRPITTVEPFVVPASDEISSLSPAEQARYVVDHPYADVSRPLHRLARKLLGASVGLALGGGAAFGIAHVGVLEVLEQHGIPVDLTIGTSMGSIVALGYAAGIRPHEMREIAQRIGNKRTTLSALDITASGTGLLSGNRLVSIFSPLLGDVQTFEQLVLPCQTVAADIESGERVCIGEGRLDDAFRASCSVPLIWAPVRRDGRTLVDGGMVDPVPAEVVRMAGADLCVAVNVVPQLQKGVTTALSRMAKRVNTLNPLAWRNGARNMPNVFDVVMNSIQVLQYELGNFKAISADVRINADLSDFTWIEFYKPMEIIERGAAAAEQAVPALRKLLDDRMRQPA